MGALGYSNNSDFYLMFLVIYFIVLCEVTLGITGCNNWGVLIDSCTYYLDVGLSFHVCCISTQCQSVRLLIGYLI